MPVGRGVSAMRAARRRAMTLIELMMSVALATIIVGVVASVTVQVQRTIGAAQMREDIARNARALFTDIETDLSRMIPQTTAAPPFDKVTAPVTPRPLCLVLG